MKAEDNLIARWVQENSEAPTNKDSMKPEEQKARELVDRSYKDMHFLGNCSGCTNCFNVKCKLRMKAAIRLAKHGADDLMNEYTQKSLWDRTTYEDSKIVFYQKVKKEITKLN